MDKVVFHTDSKILFISILKIFCILSEYSEDQLKFILSSSKKKTDKGFRSQTFFNKSSSIGDNKLGITILVLISDL